MCPFSFLEPFIQSKFGKGVFFLTAMGAELDLQSKEYVQIIQWMIKHENIDEVIVVNDTSCRFIQRVNYSASESQYKTEQLLSQRFNDVSIDTDKEVSTLEKQILLATWNVKQQVLALKTSDLFTSLSSNQIKLSGLVTTKATNQCLEVNLSN